MSYRGVHDYSLRTTSQGSIVGLPGGVCDVQVASLEEVTVFGVACAVANDVVSGHQDRGARSHGARAPWRLFKEHPRIVLPTVAMSGECLGNPPVDFTVGGMEEGWWDAGDREDVEELSALRLNQIPGPFLPTFVDTHVCF